MTNNPFISVDPLNLNTTMTVECGKGGLTSTAAVTTPSPSPGIAEDQALNNSKVTPETKNDTLTDSDQKENAIDSKQNLTDTGQYRTIDIIDDSGHVRELTTLRRLNPTIPPQNSSGTESNPDDNFYPDDKDLEDEQVVGVVTDETLDILNDGQKQKGNMLYSTIHSSSNHI